MPEAYFAKKSRNHSFTDFPIFEDLCGFKKNERSLEKRVNFAQNTNFGIFPQKVNMRAHFPNISDFLHVWCVFYNTWKLVMLKVILCLRYSKVVVMNSHLKSGEIGPNTNFDIFPQKQYIKAHFLNFSYFYIFGSFLKKHSVCPLKSLFFWIRTNLLKLENPRCCDFVSFG